VSAAPSPVVALTAEQSRAIRTADALVRRCVDAAAIEAARHKVAIGEASAAGRRLVEGIVEEAGQDPTLDWQMVGDRLVPAPPREG